MKKKIEKDSFTRKPNEVLTFILVISSHPSAANHTVIRFPNFS